MLKNLAVIAVFGALLIGRPSSSEDKSRNSRAKTNVTAPKSNVVPPPRSTVGEHSSVTTYQINSTCEQQQPAEKPLPRFVRPEWIIVYVTIGYTLLALLGWITIKRQADLMEQQNIISVNKEKARIAIRMADKIPDFLWPDYLRETRQEPLDYDPVTIAVTNEGQTSAYEAEVAVTIVISGDNGAMWNEFHDVGTIKASDTPIEVQLNLLPAIDLHTDQIIAIKAGTAVLSVFGGMLYKTAFSDDRVPKLFCFKWKVVLQDGATLYPYGGIWDVCPKEKQTQEAD